VTIVKRNYKNLEAWIAKEIIKIPLYRTLPPDNQLNQFVVVREGLSVELAMSHGLAESYKEFLPNDSEEISVSEMKKVFIERHLRNKQKVDELMRIILGSAFAKQFLIAYSLEELEQWPRTRLLGVFSSFLQEG
jgi:hypothetical protein